MLATILFRYVSFRNIFGSLAWIASTIALLTFGMACILRQYNILEVIKNFLQKSKHV